MFYLVEVKLKQRLQQHRKKKNNKQKNIYREKERFNVYMYILHSMKYEKQTNLNTLRLNRAMSDEVRAHTNNIQHKQ